MSKLKVNRRKNVKFHTKVLVRALIEIRYLDRDHLWTVNAFDVWLLHKCHWLSFIAVISDISCDAKYFTLYANEWQINYARWPRFWIIWFAFLEDSLVTCPNIYLSLNLYLKRQQRTNRQTKCSVNRTESMTLHRDILGISYSKAKFIEFTVSLHVSQIVERQFF